MRPSNRQITAADLILGVPLPFSVYDDEGRLLLRQGVVLTMPAQVSRIVERGVLMGVADAPARGAGNASSGEPGLLVALHSRAARQAGPVFEQMGSLILNLKHALVIALKMPAQIDLGLRVRQFAAKLQALCLEDADSALAAPHLDHATAYIIVHQVMGAVLAELIGRRCGMPEPERLSLVCAALTRDIGMFAWEAELDGIKGPLTAALRHSMQSHPTGGAIILRRAGIDDPLWLGALEQHHERLDGAGYPRALAGDAIGAGGRILAVADVYSAMTKPRPYREREYMAQSALREMFRQKEPGLDPALVQILIKEVGLLPPGSIIKLKNGEVAVIKQRTHALGTALAYTVYDQHGMPLLDPVRRDCAEPAFEVVGTVSFSTCRAAALTIKRVWLT